ncbi:MAG: flagellar hook-associated protein FlgK, partial [Lautropia sp.]
MSLISIGQSGLAAAYAQLQTTGNNIANVNTPGYVRQEVVLEPAPEQYSGAGSLARGVQVADIRRNYDHYLGREVTVNAALAGADRARADSLGRLDSLLADTNDGLGVAIDDLRAAFGDLVNQPNDPSAREVAIRRADALAERFRSTADQMSRLAVNTDQRIADDAGYVNTRLESIAALNSRITLQTATGRTPADLMDQRDRLIDEVAAKLQLSRRNEPDGSVSLFSASGHTLVLSGSA